MNRNNKPISKRRYMRGQSAFEYVVGCIIVLVILGATFVGEDGNSVVDLFLEKTEKSYDNLSGAVSLPI